jgi:hypothetical protein
LGARLNWNRRNFGRKLAAVYFVVYTELGLYCTPAGGPCGGDDRAVAEGDTGLFGA